ncbi:uncharacterized protein LOC129928052 isoform X2 [Biomphalaria glabrata]|nr:uncharacterized protein LOC129928052 isoform X2 [Biomphalaria glabrata]XP_055896094.1 uncharacterized protein LOC129928052 isoform X2 [Biomphalaria glabrata]XP_055896095.1 uncharacterized protein LOC129928052 isoform X2 [Biomphalaria glabrata]XP_055896096.1 uncharacterized protein LOC129928052 isoform X2 [Biomphalaria glabrata]
MSANKEELTVLLLGKKGSGRNSVTGVLDDTLDSTVDVSEALIFEKRLRDDHQCRLHIFKAPGIWDIDKLETSDGFKQMSDDMLRLMQHVNDSQEKGITAFLFVMNINEKFKQEDKKLIFTFQSIFGDDNFWERCIIVCTDRKYFEGDFIEWIDNQTGVFAALIDKCNKRLVLIKIKANQYDSSHPLLTEIINVKRNHRRNYTLNDYMKQERWLPRIEEIPKTINSNSFPEDHFWIRFEELERKNLNKMSFDEKWEFGQQLAVLKYHVSKADAGTNSLISIKRHITDLEQAVFRDLKGSPCKIL